jgi:uncharacterized membrane protein HdeD (DUF308 family)
MTTDALVLEFRDLRHKWGWLLAIGISMVVLGAIALFITPAATLGTILVLGWLLVVSGVVETIQSFRVRRWSGIFLHLIGGVLGILVGLLIVTHPLAGALATTLLFASFFTVIGLFRLVAAIRLKFPHWGWAAFDGAVTLLLGLLLWMEWPVSGLWFIGFAVGISLLLRGWSYIMFAIAVRSVPGQVTPMSRAA